MNVTNTHQKTLRMVTIALFAAIVVVIQLFMASVKIGPVTIAFSLVPIVLSGIFLGPFAGLIIGTVSGVVTFLQVFTSGDYFYVFLITNNALATALICILKSAIAGWLSGLSYSLVKKTITTPTISTIFPAIVCPTVNTGIFCLGMLIFFTSHFKADTVFAGMSENIINFVFIGLAGINYVVELISTVVITPIISKALIAAKVFK